MKSTDSATISSSSAPSCSQPTSTLITSDTDLLALLQVRLCRFCSGPSTASRPFVGVCACQGPNSATHAACLEAYLEAHRHNRSRCDVCCHAYHFRTSRRSALEWAVSSDAWDDAGSSTLPQLLQLTVRTMNISWALVMSLLIVLSTTTYFEKPAKEAQSTGGIKNAGEGASSSGAFQIAFGLLIIAFSLFRLAWVVRVLVEVGRATRDQMKDWLEANQKVTLCSTGLRSTVQDKASTPSTPSTSTSSSSSSPSSPTSKKECKLIGHSAIRAAGLRQPKVKTLVKTASVRPLSHPITPKSKHSTAPKSNKKDV